MRALITGATGFIGSHLVDRLLARGDHVRCTIRRNSDLRWLQDKRIERYEADLRDGNGLDGAFEGVDVVYHGAGVLTAPDLSTFMKGNWLATKHLIEAASRARGLRRFVYVSTLAVVGPAPDERPLDESRFGRPVSNYGRSKKAAEEEVLRYRDRVPVTVIRPPVVYGPRDRALRLLYQGVKRGFVLILGGEKRVSIVHVNDLVEGIVAASDASASIGQVYFIADEQEHTVEELILQVARSLRRTRLLLLHLTDGGARALSGGIESLFSLLGLDASFMSRDKVLEMTQRNWICTPAKAKRDFGYVSRISLEKGFADTLNWYIRERWL